MKAHDSSSSLFSEKMRRFPVMAVLLTSTLAITACGGKKQASTAAAQSAAPEVGVVVVQPATLHLGTELPGRLEAFKVAEVRARVAGIVLKRHFREGSEVKEGQLLFTIDSAPYRAALSSAQANHAQAAALVRRYRPLVEANAVSKQEYETAVASEKIARAQVETARINLGYTHVTAPISGRIGRELVTVGALVGQGQATHMATIQQTDRLYINLSQSANDVLQLRQALRNGKLESSSGEEGARVAVVLDNGEAYPHEGRLLFTDLSVDPGTGEVSLRAEVPNPERFLLPGMYVRVRLEQAQVDNAVLLPQQAVTRTDQGDTVLVVAPDNTFAPRTVQIDQAQGNDWVVVGGLKQGEKVIVDGVMKLRPGIKQVTPVPFSPASPSGAKTPMASAARAATDTTSMPTSAVAGTSAPTSATITASAPAPAASNASR